jgi:hypothetical protein
VWVGPAGSAGTGGDAVQERARVATTEEARCRRPSSHRQCQCILVFKPEMYDSDKYEIARCGF